MIKGPLAEYRELVRTGALAPDTEQELAAEKLQLLHRRLISYNPVPLPPVTGWRARFKSTPAPPASPEGLYLVGGVGRGKSMLMDLFFKHAPVERKRRVHFHAFMLDVHKRIHEWRRIGRHSHSRIGADPIPPVAKALTELGWLLCFDEFQVLDPADALILQRLFTALFDNGVVVVATSNRVPDDLYQGGLNRDRFQPGIDLLKERMDIIILDGETDYRLERIMGMQVYFTPLNSAAAAALDEDFDRLTDNAKGKPDEIVLRGRRIAVPTAAKGVARFRFTDLCEAAMGAEDYLAIAQLYHTVIIAEVPQLGPAKRNEAKRFVTLIDALYEHKVKLIVSAAAEPDALYPRGHGAFEFTRTASRLHEMQSREYLAAHQLT